MLEGHDQAPVLVTGATSQIGRRVLGRLSAADVSVAALSRRLPAEAEDENAQLIVGDLTQPALDIGQDFPSLVHIAGIWLLPPHISNLHRNGLRRLVCFSSTAIYNKLDSITASERDVARRMIAAEKSIAEQCDSIGIQDHSAAYADLWPWIGSKRQPCGTFHQENESLPVGDRGNRSPAAGPCRRFGRGGDCRAAIG